MANNRVRGSGQVAHWIWRTISSSGSRVKRRERDEVPLSPGSCSPHLLSDDHSVTWLIVSTSSLDSIFSRLRVGGWWGKGFCSAPVVFLMVQFGPVPSLDKTCSFVPSLCKTASTVGFFFPYQPISLLTIKYINLHIFWLSTCIFTLITLFVSKDRKHFFKYHFFVAI
jgi:hypothetical protein